MQDAGCRMQVKVKVEDVSYGLLRYNAMNIGDEIQSLAASRFLPSIDEYIYRELISEFIPEKGKKTKCIMNAWWMWRPNHFPPSDWIEPLLISMHFTPAARKQMLSEKGKAFFRKYGPVGCRDIGSTKWLQDNGVDSYFSGCLTLTLLRNPDIPREDYILCVDVAEDVVDEIRSRTKRPVYSIERHLSTCYDSKQRLEVARCMLALYHNASCCVSTRLHVIMPCLAMETPVLRLLDNDINTLSGGDARGDDRYAGFENFHHTLSIEELMKNKDIYNFDNPPPNPQNHLAMREQLIERCSAFTGYDSNKSPVPTDINVGVEMLRLNAYRYKNVQKTLYWGRISDLLKALLVKCCGGNHHDVEFGDKIDFRGVPLPWVWAIGKKLDNLIQQTTGCRYFIMNFLTRGRNEHYRKKYEAYKNR